MKQHWDVEELVEHFTLLPPEIGVLGNNSAPHNYVWAKPSS